MLRSGDMRLLGGDEALTALGAMLDRGAGIPTIEIDPAARGGAPLQVVVIAKGEEQVLLDARGSAGFGARLAAAAPCGAHDAKAVHRALLRAGEVAPARWACTRLSEMLIAGGRDTSLDLESIAARLDLPEPPPADGGFDALGARARSVSRVLAAQIDDIRQDQLGWVSKIEAAAVAPIAEMEHHGMAVDATQWRALLTDAEREREALRHEVGRHFAEVTGADLFGDAAVNLDADADLKRALHALGHEVPNVRRATLADLPPPLGPALRRYRELSKIVHAYGEGFLQHVQEDGRVHPTFEQIGASTGRMACHAPNLQAIVKDSGFRDCFACPEERRLVVADYATCELRILAQMSGDPVFADAFARGDDLHAIVASSMFGERVSKTENPELRQRAKAINFGLVYGMGAAGLGRQIGVDVDAARALLERYFTTFPKIRAFLEGNARRALQRGWAVTLTGRRLYLEVGGDRSARAAAERIAKNMPIQGTSADMTKLALGKLRTALEAHPGAFPVNAVHDEIVVECDASAVDAVRHSVVDAMVAAGRENPAGHPGGRRCRGRENLE